MDKGVPFFRLFEKRSAKGNTYFRGYLGDAEVLILKDERCDEPRFGAEAEWQVFLKPREKQAARELDKIARDGAQSHA